MHAKPIKSVPIGGNKHRVLAIPFGGPLEGKDTDQEFFSPRTDIKPHWYDRRPVLFHHGQDPTVKDDDIGYASDLEMDDEGWWVTVWLDKAGRYWNRINQLLEAKAMFGSSGTSNYLAKIDHQSGEILTWPFMEETLTPTPANFFSRLETAKSLFYFDLEGPTADLPADLPDEGGDAAAIQRLADELNRLEELIKTL